MLRKNNKWLKGDFLSIHFFCYSCSSRKFKNVLFKEVLYMIPLCFENYKMELAVVYLRQVHLLFLFLDCFLYFIQIGTYGKPHTFAVRRRIIFPSKKNLTNRSKTKSLQFLVFFPRILPRNTSYLENCAHKKYYVQQNTGSDTEF